MGQTYCCLSYHLVFSTKHRRTWITPDLRPRLYSYMGAILKEENNMLLAIGGMEDHLHIFAGLHQDASVSAVVRNVKAKSSGWIHRTYSGMQDFSWQSGYGAFTVSASLGDKLRRYIQNQEVHHRKSDFKTEFRALLVAHGIEFDERYVLD